MAKIDKEARKVEETEGINGWLMVDRGEEDAKNRNC